METMEDMAMAKRWPSAQHWIREEGDGNKPEGKGIAYGFLFQR